MYLNLDIEDIPDDVYGLTGEIKDWKELDNPISKRKFLYLILYQEILEGATKLSTSKLRLVIP